MNDSYDFIDTETEGSIDDGSSNNSCNNNIQHNSNRDEPNAVNEEAETENPLVPTMVERIVLVVADVIRRLR
jgi:hypothetical protein